jgi:hypothetical protein
MLSVDMTAGVTSRAPRYGRWHEGCSGDDQLEEGADDRMELVGDTLWEQQLRQPRCGSRTWDICVEWLPNVHGYR